MRERNFLCRERVKTNAHARSIGGGEKSREHLTKINTERKRDRETERERERERKCEQSEQSEQLQFFPNDK